MSKLTIHKKSTLDPHSNTNQPSRLSTEFLAAGLSIVPFDSSAMIPMAVTYFATEYPIGVGGVDQNDWDENKAPDQEEMQRLIWRGRIPQRDR